MSNLFAIQVSSVSSQANDSGWIIGQYIALLAWSEWIPTDRLADAKFFSTAAACMQAVKQINRAHPYLTLKTLQFKQV